MLNVRHKLKYYINEIYKANYQSAKELRRRPYFSPTTCHLTQPRGSWLKNTQCLSRFPDRQQSLLASHGLFRSTDGHVESSMHATHRESHYATMNRTNLCSPRVDVISCEIGNEAVIRSSQFPARFSYFSTAYPVSISLSSPTLKVTCRTRLVAGTSWRRLGGKRRWIAAGRRQTRVQNRGRPGRVDSSANFQIYTLAVRSRAACYGRQRESEGYLLDRLGHTRGPRVRTTYQCLREPVEPADDSSVEKFPFDRASRLKVRSVGFDGVNVGTGFCENQAQTSFPAI